MERKSNSLSDGVNHGLKVLQILLNHANCDREERLQGIFHQIKNRKVVERVQNVQIKVMGSGVSSRPVDCGESMMLVSGGLSTA